MSSFFSDLDMLYDYEKDTIAAAAGYMTIASRVSSKELITRYLHLANEAGKVCEKARSLIEKSGGIA